MKAALDTAATEVSPNPSRDLVIPAHELVCCVGRGSYGEVWLSRNTMMGNFRAVKIVFKDRFKDRHPYEREIEGIRKFEPISRSHEGFIDVLQVGRNEAGGYFYYVMEVGDDVTNGQTIDPDNYVPKTLFKEISIRGRQSLEECLRLGLSISSALDRLHQQGLIHRDVKPSNIIFVHGVPKLADIGLVAEIERASSYVGTEGFIPPQGPNSPQSDIYGLGKVLYEMATGKDRQDFPALPDDFQKLPDRPQLLELNEVLVKACHQEAPKRYQTAQEMHADLKVLENGYSVKRLRLLERRWARVKSVGKPAVMLLIILSVAGYVSSRHYREVAEQRERQVGAEIATGTHALEAGNYLASLPHFVEALRLDQHDARQIETHQIRLASVLAYCPKLAQLWLHEGRVNSVEISPDGREVLAAGWWKKAQVRDLESGERVSPEFGPKEGLLAASFSPDGRLVITASDEYTHVASVWRCATGEEVYRLKHPDCVFSAAFGRSGIRVVTGCKDKNAYIWDAATGKRLLTLNAHTGSLLCAQFSADEQYVVTAGMDGTAMLWNARTGQRMGQPLEHTSWVYFASFSPDGQRLVTASFERKARLWEVPSGRELPAVMHHGDGVRSARFSPDGRYILTASLDGTVRLWDAQSGLPLARNAVLKHSSRVMDAAFSPDGRRIATSCADGTVRVFDLAGSPFQLQLLPGVASSDGTRTASSANTQVKVHPTPLSELRPTSITTPRMVRGVTLNREGRFALTLYEPTNVSVPSSLSLQVWNTVSGEAASPVMPCTNSLAQASLSEDGRRLALVAGRAVSIMDVPSGTRLATLSHLNQVTMACFGKDHGALATVSANQVHVWDATRGVELFPALRLTGNVSHVEFSPQGHRLLTCTTDDTLSERAAQIWDAATGKAVSQALWHRDGVLFAAWSLDGRRIVTASEDFTAIVWDAATGKQLLPALEHRGQVRGAAFSPHGRWIVTVSSDKMTRLWDAETGVPLTPPLEHRALFERAVFLPEGRSFVTTTSSGQAWLWKLPRDHHSVEALESLSRLLAGTWQPGGDAQSRMQTAWRSLVAAHPDDFRAQDSEVAAWHAREAEDAEKNKHWFGARFHLERLRAMRPQDQALAKRLAQAQKALGQNPVEILAQP
ncbi:MAG: protein kinase [Verrucomicrobia bacterium]|nr:protein kinase [Verrucomicrobiota bacterium]